MIKIRRSENNSILGRPRSEKKTLAEHSHFKWWFTSRYITSGHQIADRNGISSHFLIWYLTSDLDWAYHEKLQSSVAAEKLAEHRHFKYRSASWLFGSPHKISAWYPSGVVQAYRGQLKALWNARRLAEHSHLYSGLLYGTVHPPAKLQTDSWNSLQWRHNGLDSVSNHLPNDCLLNRLFRRRSKKKTKLRVTGLCAGNSPGIGEFPAQMAS